jgi:exo-beta-1,3-glucanase (GH17 family)
MRAGLALSIGLALAACHAPSGHRTLTTIVDGQWIGSGICYGPHRDGQRPGGAAPSDDQLRADLRLMAARWHLLRIYGADPPADHLLAIIRAEHLPFKVMLGASLAPEPAGAAANQAQVAAAIALANAYPDVVVAVVVGNETQVSWSDHKLALDALIGHLREVRAHTQVPVTTADDFAFWLTPASDRLDREVDLIVMHAHPMWNSQPLEHALAFTQARYAEVAARHPTVPIFLGEAGWATGRGATGDQARLITGVADEAAQAAYFAQWTAWTTRDRIPSTYFEAFDENWKGGDDPAEVEKHWGLFRADRTAKPAVAP